MDRYFIKITFVLLAFALCFCKSEKKSEQENRTGKEILRFNENGEFKIAQFTDTHINIDNESNMEVYDIIRDVIAIEKPDFVILTGDIMTQNQPQRAYEPLAKMFEDLKMPWAVIFGNHESERDFSRESLAQYLEEQPYCLNDDVGDIAGNSNFILPVYGKSNNIEALLYCMDSHNRSTLEPLVGGYGWFDFSQVMWYREKSREYTGLNGGKPYPALAFFHIPLPEYTDAWNNTEIPPLGVKNEDECSPEINTGMFAAMLECGDVMGTFVGHDHINDYIGVHYGIALAYGRVSKVMRNPDEDPLAGGRIIVLKEGKREFETWIRDMDGVKELEFSWPVQVKE